MTATGLHALTDCDLIKLYLKGDDAAFETLYGRYRKPLYAFLNQMLPGQSAVVDDLYQQTWLRILKNMKGYREKNKFLAWAFRIARNLVIDHIRKEGKVEYVDPNEHDLGMDHQLPSSAASNKELHSALQQAVADLPPDQREVFLLRQRDLSFKEIAQIQETSVNTALGRMRYATMKLQSQLSDWL
jgi:RNA polymerase sigma-70 factor (ECF subfamily)